VQPGEPAVQGMQAQRGMVRVGFKQFYGSEIARGEIGMPSQKMFRSFPVVIGYDYSPILHQRVLVCADF
jgi:hypothetical protein